MKKEYVLHTLAVNQLSQKRRRQENPQTQWVKKNKGDTETSGLLSRKKVHFMHAF